MTEIYIYIYIILYKSYKFGCLRTSVVYVCYIVYGRTRVRICSITVTYTTLACMHRNLHYLTFMYLKQSIGSVYLIWVHMYVRVCIRYGGHVHCYNVRILDVGLIALTFSLQELILCCQAAGRCKRQICIALMILTN